MRLNHSDWIYYCIKQLRLNVYIFAITCLLLPDDSTLMTIFKTIFSDMSETKIGLFPNFGKSFAEGKIFATQMSPNVIETQYGKLRGLLITLSYRNYTQVEAYYGLQYASLLGGELRFMPPTSTTEKWEGVRVALSHRPVCPQRVPNEEEFEGSPDELNRFLNIKPFLERQSEECLNLNIYVPVKRNVDKKAVVSFPVLVMLLCESYEYGTGNAYDATVMSARLNSIVITLNFRLGPLAFVSASRSRTVAHNAQLDQIAALVWVQENIARFSGDPSRITLLGQGYGADMANMLLLSPLAKGLFQRVILQSGSVLSPVGYSPEPLPYLFHLAQTVNCSQHWNVYPTLIQCLRNLPFEKLVAVKGLPPSYSVQFRRSGFGPAFDQPNFGQNNLRGLMESMADTVAFGSVALLIGYNEKSVNDDLLKSVQHPIALGVMQQFVRDLVEKNYRYHSQTIYDILMHQYRDWNGEGSNSGVLDNLSEFLGDAFIRMPLLEVAHLHSNSPRISSAPTYFYIFNNTRTSKYTNKIGNEKIPISEDKLQRYKSYDELEYIIGSPMSDGISPYSEEYSDNDRDLSETMMKYWKNFIYTGNPNGNHVTAYHTTKPMEDISLGWPKFTKNNPRQLVLDAKPHIVDNYRASRTALWLNLLPKIQQLPHDPSTAVRCRQLSEVNSLERDSSSERAIPNSCLNDMTANRTATDKPAAYFVSQAASGPVSPDNGSLLARLSDEQAATVTLVGRQSTTARGQQPSVSNSKRNVNNSSPAKDYSKEFFLIILSGGILLFINVVALVWCSQRRKRKLRMEKRRFEQAIMEERDFNCDISITPNEKPFIDPCQVQVKETSFDAYSFNDQCSIAPAKINGRFQEPTLQTVSLIQQDTMNRNSQLTASTNVNNSPFSTFRTAYS